MRWVIPSVIAIAAAGVMFAVPDAQSQRSTALLDPETAAAELERATRESAKAKERAERLQSQAAGASEAADKAAREAAALAAQIQQAEADITAAGARYSLAQADRAAVSARLDARREPLVRLTSALQTTARRPLALSALQPGSLKDLVYVRAVLSSAVPEIRRRTGDLRGELDLSRNAEAKASDALAALRRSEDDLQARRTELAAIEQRQRLASKDARSNAVRENERALGLAEEARDLDGLIDRLDDDAKLRSALAALPGPKLRPANLSAIAASSASDLDPESASEPAASNVPPPSPYQLPVQGRTVAGFGEARPSGLRSNGIVLAPASAAQVVAPAGGRVVFAGPYRGYDRIVIIEHADGWTSLITGLARVDAEVGTTLISGSPLGVAARSDPIISLELRRAGKTVNPLIYLQ